MCGFRVYPKALGTILSFLGEGLGFGGYGFGSDFLDPKGLG